MRNKKTEGRKFRTAKGIRTIKKIPVLLEEKEYIRFRYIKELADSLNIKKACKLLNVSLSGYYKYLERKPSARDIENSVLSTEIQQIFNEHKSCYGSLRITKVLEQKGIHVTVNGLVDL